MNEVNGIEKRVKKLEELLFVTPPSGISPWSVLKTTVEIEDLGDRIETLGSKIEKLESHEIEDFDDRIETLEKGIENLESHVDDVIAKIEDSNDDIAGVSTKIEDLEENIGDVMSRLDNIETDISKDEITIRIKRCLEIFLRNSLGLEASFNDKQQS